MANEFMNVPGWFSHENQGAGITVVSLGNDGNHDLIVLSVDSPQGKNQGFYRVGKRLDANGQVTGGWSNWIPVPDWFSWENQGADITVSDLNGNGKPDLVVFMIDNPPGKNQGYYKVGRDLDSNGQVTGGWSNWIPIPDWFSWENQDGGIVVANLEGNNERALLIFMIDNPPGKNQGFYKVGKKLDANGNVTGGWSGWIPVPDWFSSENQGAGVAVVDLENSGLQDLVIFQIDSPPGPNQAFYKVGKNINADGMVTGGWSSWLGVPDWFSHENQGAGVASVDLSSNGKHDLIFFHGR